MLPSFNEADYKEILRQAISQIRATRIQIARQVNSSTQSFIGIWENCFQKDN